jgi:hypothetical protein
MIKMSTTVPMPMYITSNCPQARPAIHQISAQSSLTHRLIYGRATLASITVRR